MSQQDTIQNVLTGVAGLSINSSASDAPPQQDAPSASDDTTTPVVDAPVSSEAPVETLTPVAPSDPPIIVDVTPPAPAPIVVEPTPTLSPSVMSAPVNTDNTDPYFPTNVSSGSQVVIGIINNYVSAMKPPKQIVPARGGEQQMQLFRALVYVINTIPNEDFGAVFTGLLKLIKSNSGNGQLFHECNAVRFMPSTLMQKSDCDCFTRLINMLRIMADPVGRKLAVKQVKLERALAFPITDSGRNRVLNYFGV